MKIVKKFPKEKIERVFFKKLTQKKLDNGDDSSFLELYYKDKMIEIFPEGDCCSFSYIVEFTKYPFKYLVDKKIMRVDKVENEKLSGELFKYVRILEDRKGNDRPESYLYKIELENKRNFYFGLINISNGWYDGWIEIYENQL